MAHNAAIAWATNLCCYRCLRKYHDWQTFATVKYWGYVHLNFGTFESDKVVRFSPKISQVMYDKLKTKEIENEKEAREFIAEFGEQAYIERQKLL